MATASSTLTASSAYAQLQGPIALPAQPGPDLSGLAVWLAGALVLGVLTQTLAPPLWRCVLRPLADALRCRWQLHRLVRAEAEDCALVAQQMLTLARRHRLPLDASLMQLFDALRFARPDTQAHRQLHALQQRLRRLWPRPCTP